MGGRHGMPDALDRPTGGDTVKRLQWALLVMAAVAAIAAAATLARREGMPDAAGIQAAYEREFAGGSSKHDPGLRVRTAECNSAGPAAYVCSVAFTSAADRDERLYLDIVQVDRAAAGWVLKSGLCRS